MVIGWEKVFNAIKTDVIKIFKGGQALGIIFKLHLYGSRGNVINHENVLIPEVRGKAWITRGGPGSGSDVCSFSVHNKITHVSILRTFEGIFLAPSRRM